MRTLALGAIGLAGFLAACGGDDGDTVNPTPDARTIDTSNPGACDPLAAAGQQGCQPGQKCAWVVIQEDPESIGKIACVPDGTVEAGGTCMFGAPGEATGFDDCRAGSVCVGGSCKDVCGFGGGANEACASGQACTRYADLWANGDDDPLYGACNPTCDPVTQLRSDGSNCGNGQGCYLLVSNTTSTAVCAGAGDVEHNATITGQAFANSCVPGAQPRRANPTDMTVECGGLCDVEDVFVIDPANVTFDNGNMARPVAKTPAQAAQVMNYADEAGKASPATEQPSSCTEWGGASPGTPNDGESCRYWWARESFDDISPFSNTVGWCFKHDVFQFDSDGNMQADAPFPRCAAISQGDNVLPVANPPHNDAMYFWCVALPTMLQTSAKNVKKSVDDTAIRMDRLSNWR